ncbi:SNF2-related protein [Peptoniphilus sp. GNH]|nr:SNF2-related protein [Peptoniphilus sp. GNH]
MAIKYSEYKEILESKLTNFLGNKEYKEFLKDGAYNYKYDFKDQVSIFSQFKNARACASYGFWNKYKRYVKRGSQGIAISSRNDRQLNYIYDISQTGGAKESKIENFVWELKSDDLEKYFNNKNYGYSFLRKVGDKINSKEDLINNKHFNFIKDSILYRVSSRLNIGLEENNFSYLDVPKSMSILEFSECCETICTESKELINMLRIEIERGVENERIEVSSRERTKNRLSDNRWQEADLSGGKWNVDSRNRNGRGKKTDREMGIYEAGFLKDEQGQEDQELLPRTSLEHDSMETFGGYRGDSGEFHGNVRTSSAERARSDREYEVDKLYGLGSFSDTSERNSERDDRKSNNLRLNVEDEAIYSKRLDQDKIISEEKQKEVIEQISMASFIESNNKKNNDIKVDRNKELEILDSPIKDKSDYWIVEFNETGEFIDDYSGQQVTKQLINFLRQKDIDIKLQNQLHGEDEFGEITDDYIGYFKFYFDHYVDGEVIEHHRIDIGDGKDVNEREFSYIEEQIELSEKNSMKENDVNNKNIKIGDVVKINDNEYWLIKNIKKYTDMYTAPITLYGFDAYWNETLKDFKYSNTERIKNNNYEIVNNSNKLSSSKEINNIPNKNENITKISDSSYDPLSVDSDNDGIPDRYDSAPLNSEVQSIGDLEKLDNFRYYSSEENGSFSERLNNNVEAILMLNRVESGERSLDFSAQEVLSKYVGWGGLSEVFDTRKEKYTYVRKILKENLSLAEYDSAKESSLTSFYTPNKVIKAIYSGVKRLGFKEGNILEPSSGIGKFVGNAPEDIKGKFHLVEVDNISHRIAKHLYPNAKNYLGGYENTNFKNDSFDLAIGNIPFGNFQVFDKEYKNNFMIHDYFIDKSIDKVRNGGIVAFITTSGTLDKVNSKFREHIAKKADFLGAMRLPNNTFSDTSVTSDILFFQKNTNKSFEIDNEKWIKIAEDENGLKYNEYFINHPEMVLGEMKEVSGRFGSELSCLPNSTIPIDDQIIFATNNLPKNVFSNTKGIYDVSYEENDSEIRPFSYGIKNNKIYYSNTLEEVKTNRPEALKAMIRLRDNLRLLYDLEINNNSDDEVEAQRIKINSLYDSFVDKNGYINKKENLSLFKNDDSIAILKSLEKFDNGKYQGKADVFSKRVVKGNFIPNKANSIEDALLICINTKGKVDLKYIAELREVSIESAKEELLKKELIFLDPENPKNFIEKTEYLSGDVKAKLKEANSLSKFNSDYKKNCEALEKVVPKDIEASDISVRLGASWIPSEYISEFISQKLNLYSFSYSGSAVEYSDVSSKWHINDKISYHGIANEITYGTQRMKAIYILEKTLNLNENLKIYDTKTENGEEIKVLNAKETMLVREKQEKIKSEFKNWIFEDPQRRKRLERIYNDKFNCIVPRKYDGSKLYFSGISSEIDLREHQKNVVARSLFGGNTLVGHEVGAGKTFSAIASIMESKRLGFTNKALIVVPNHITEQWGNDFLKLYPNANILIATKNDFKKEKRQELFGKIANGNYDAVIISHSQFSMIPLSDKTQTRFINEELNELREKIKNADDKSYSVKQAIQAEKKLKSKLNSLLDKSKKDLNVVNFEELGIDKLIVDEAHEFKNLQIATSLSNIKGVSISPSQKAFDLYSKCRYLDEATNKKGIMFLTGTPVSNSMAELFVMQKYLQHDLLKEKGLLNFDSWVSTFGDIKNTIDLKVEGTGYQSVTKFAGFENVPELMFLFRENSDILTADKLNLPVPELEKIVVESTKSKIQEELFQSIAERAEKVRGGLDSRIDNFLAITTDGKKLALDQRLLDSSLPESPDSKVNKAVENIYNIWNKTSENKLTQMVFCDNSTPDGESAKKLGFNVYDDIKSKLISSGVPENEIAFIHDAKTEIEKDILFDKVRKGDIRILIGSTQKMGTGTNVQERLVALHNLDAPWRPADLSQRLGRMVRQGNINKKVQEFTYVTKGTFDAYMFQTLENKQRFLSQIMNNDNINRSYSDVDEVVLNYAEIKAICADNPLIKEKMELENDISKMDIEKSAHLANKAKLEIMISKFIPERISLLKSDIENLSKDRQNLLSCNKNFEIVLDGIKFDKKADAGQKLKEIIDRSSSNGKAIGKYKNFILTLKTNEFDKSKYLDIKDNYSYSVTLGESGVGNMQKIENAIENIDKIINSKKSFLEDEENSLQDAKIQVNKPYDKDDIYMEKLKRLKEINFTFDSEYSEYDLYKAQEDIIEKAEEFSKSFEINFSDINNVEIANKSVLGNDVKFVADLEKFQLKTILNDSEVIDVKENQSLKDFIDFSIKPLNIDESLKKLVAEEKISAKELDISNLEI